ncbi:MAG: hypothetical protein ACXAE3_06555 [Candidatus Kariarchaeaceae archaeon]|jgi:tetratricopeptide (TPR) repeat protein
MEEGIELQMYDLYKERKWEEVIQLSKEIEHPQAANYYLMSLTHTGGIEAVRDEIVKIYDKYKHLSYWRMRFAEALAGILLYDAEFERLIDLCREDIAFGKTQDPHETYGDLPELSYWLGRLHMQIGVGYDHLGFYKTALEYEYQSLEIMKEYNHTHGIPLSLYNIAYCHWVRGEIQKATEAVEEGLALNPEDFILRDQRAEIRRVVGEYQDELEDLTFLLESTWRRLPTTKTHALHFRMSEAYRKLGDGDREKEHAEKFWSEFAIVHDEEVHPRERNFMTYYEAVMHKNSRRFRDKIKGEGLLRDFIQANSYRYHLTIESMAHLIELLLDEYRSTEEPEVMDEIDGILEEMEQIAVDRDLPGTAVKILLLKSRIAVAENNFSRSLNFLEDAEKLASSHQLKYHMTIILKEKITLREDYNKIEHILKKNLQYSASRKKNDIKDYIQMALKSIQ